MSGKEPRRRKKRNDLQSTRKDDPHPDDQIFSSSKMDPKDSDQEAEEEETMPSNQPSVFAKFIFVVLFSTIVVAMSFVFISLQGTHRREIETFDDHHAEGSEIAHDIHEDEHHDEEHHDHAEDKNGHADHDNIETWSLSKASFQEKIEELLPGIGNILSFKDDSSRETVKVEEQESLTEESVVEEIPEISDTKLDVKTEATQEDIEESADDESDDLEEEEDDEISPPTPTQEPDEILPTQETFETETSSQSFDQTTPVPAEDSAPSDPEATTYSPNAVPEPDDDDEDFVSNLERMSEENAQDDNDGEEETPSSENEDVVNAADDEIRRQLDELEKALENSPDRTLKRCEDLLQSHPGNPRLLYIKAQALDRLAESQRSNKLLEESIAEYQRVMAVQDVPVELYLSAGKRAADRMRFRGFMGKSLTLLLEMSKKLPKNVEIQNLVAVGYLMIGRNTEAKKVLYEVLKIAPESGFAKVHLGFILKTDDSNYQEAIKLLSEGLSTKEPGVKDGRFYFHLGDALHRVGKQDKALEVYNEAVKEGLFLSAYQRSLYNVNGLTGKPWWDPSSTTYAPYLKLLEKNWQTIRDEALSLTNEKISGFVPESEGLQEKGDWKQFELFARGRKIDKNCLRAPRTCALISQMPDAASCKRGQAKFSIMQPSTHVWAHTGPTNCRLRSHLGLVVPDGVTIRVAHETRSWEEGKILLFDDSFEHEVWHNGNSSRLILIVDFWHPELTAYQKKSLTPI